MQGTQFLFIGYLILISYLVNIIIFSIYGLIVSYFVFTLNPINRNLYTVNKQVNEHNVTLKANL